MRRLAYVGAATAVLVMAATGAAAGADGAHAGPQGDGTSVTPAGWRVVPAGSQTTLGSLPTASALSPDGRSLLVLNTGDDLNSVQAVDTATGQVTQTIGYAAPEGLYARVAFSPDGTHAYASAGGGEKIRVYSVTGGLLTEDQPIQLPVANPAGARVNMYPAGLAVTPDGNRLVVADQMADAASVVDPAGADDQPGALPGRAGRLQPRRPGAVTRWRHALHRQLRRQRRRCGQPAVGQRARHDPDRLVPDLGRRLARRADTAGH